MPSEHQLLVFWCQLLALVLTARALGAWMRSRGQPSVVGELAAGLILGPSVLGKLAPELQAWLFPPDPVQRALLAGLAWIGVFLLLVLTGLETDLALIRRLRTATARVALGSLLIPIGAGVALGFCAARGLRGSRGAAQRLRALHGHRAQPLGAAGDREDPHRPRSHAAERRAGADRRGDGRRRGGLDPARHRGGPRPVGRRRPRPAARHRRGARGLRALRLHPRAARGRRGAARAARARQRRARGPHGDAGGGADRERGDPRDRSRGGVRRVRRGDRARPLALLRRRRLGAPPERGARLLRAALLRHRRPARRPRAAGRPRGRAVGRRGGRAGDRLEVHGRASSAAGSPGSCPARGSPSRSASTRAAPWGSCSRRSASRSAC